MTVWRMRIACWITKATNTHSEYVILIAFQSQKWLHEFSSMLRLYVYRLSCYSRNWGGGFCVTKEADRKEYVVWQPAYRT